MISRKLYFYMSLLIAVMCFTFQSCGDDNDEPDTPASSNTKSMKIRSIKVSGPYLLEDGSGTLQNSWSDEGCNFKLFVVQGTGISYVGTKHSNETRLTDLYSDLTVNVPIPSTINTSYPYSMIAIEEDCEMNMDNGAIVCNADLTRGNPLHVFGAYVADAGIGYISVASTQYITASECLYIKNKSGKKITVKHKGFDAAEKWYYTKANERIINNNGVSIVPEGKTVGADVASTKIIEIMPDSTGFVLSRFAPTGKKMTNAKLVLEIDGKEVKTEAISSSVEIENGKPYFLRVTWDGTNLNWITSEPEDNPWGNPDPGNN